MSVKTPHPHAAIIQAWADGESIEYLSSLGEWVPLNKVYAPSFSPDTNYRIKKKTMMVNGFEVQAGETEKLKKRTEYYLPELRTSELSSVYSWEEDSFDLLYLSRGIIHLTKESSIAHAKAMLGIDPNESEEPND